MSHPKRRYFRAPATAAVAALTAALLVPIGVLAATPATAVEGACPVGFLPAPGTPATNERWTDDNVAVFAGGDFFADGNDAETEGFLVVMGNATFDKDTGGAHNVGWVGVGSQASPTPGTVMLAVGGDLTIGSSTVLHVGAGATDQSGTLLGGRVQVGGSATPAYPAPQYELYNGSLEVGMGASAVPSWAQIGDSLAVNSDAWASMPAVNPAIISGSAVTFVGDGTTTMQVFTITAAQLSGITEVYFENINDAASVVINVVGTEDVVFSPTYFADDGIRADDFASPLFGAVAQRTMWNFADTTNVTFGGSSQILGSVLAPNADFEITASMNGRVYAGGDIHVFGNGNELHNYAWNGPEYGCIPFAEGETGSVEMTKTIDSAGVAAVDRRFLSWVECTGAGIPGGYFQEGVLQAGSMITLTGLPIGAECRLFEDPDAALAGQNALPAGFMWAEPVWRINGVVVDDPVFQVVGPDAATQVEISVTNTLLGRFSMTKVVDGPAGGYVGSRGFDISYVCDRAAFDDAGLPIGGSESGSLSLASGETGMSDWYPVGTSCRVSEATPQTEQGDFDPAGNYRWLEPAITPADLVIGAADASPIAVTVTNTYALQDAGVGSFTIDKIVENPDQLAFTDSFSGGWSCTLGTQTLSGRWSLSSTDAPITVDDVPVGADCRVTEDAPADPATGGVWSAPAISPATFTVTDSPDRVEVTVTNTLRSSLAATGGTLPWWAVAAGGGLLLAGAMGMIRALMLRRRA